MASTWDAMDALNYGDIVDEDEWDKIKVNLDKLGAHKINGTVFSNIDDATELNLHYGCRAYNNAGFTHSSSGSWVSVTLNSERYDPYGFHSTALNTSRITFLYPGKYLVIAHFLWSGAGGSTRSGRIRLNNATTIAEKTGSTTIISYDVATIYDFAASDYVEMQGYQDSGGSVTISNSGNYSPEFEAHYLGV